MHPTCQGDLRENFGFKAAKDAIRTVDRKMDELDRFYLRNPTPPELDRLLAPLKPPEFAEE